MKGRQIAAKKDAVVSWATDWWRVRHRFVKLWERFLQRLLQIPSPWYCRCLPATEAKRWESDLWGRNFPRIIPWVFCFPYQISYQIHVPSFYSKLTKHRFQYSLKKGTKGSWASLECQEGVAFSPALSETRSVKHRYVALLCPTGVENQNPLPTIVSPPQQRNSEGRTLELGRSLFIWLIEGFSDNCQWLTCVPR